MTSLTVAQAAEVFGVGRNTVIRWEAEGRLPLAGRTPESHRRYRWVDIAPLVGRSPDEPTPPLGQLPFSDRYPAADLEELYVQQGLSTYGIAARLGVHQSTVWKALRDAGIDRRPRGGWHPRRPAGAARRQDGGGGSA